MCNMLWFLTFHSFLMQVVTYAFKAKYSCVTMGDFIDAHNLLWQLIQVSLYCENVNMLPYLMALHSMLLFEGSPIDPYIISQSEIFNYLHKYYKVSQNVWDLYNTPEFVKMCEANYTDLVSYSMWNPDDAYAHSLKMISQSHLSLMKSKLIN